jgi:hypothetical protein
VATSTTVSQFGVVFTFSTSREVGQFADGSWWVLGPVTINSITPDVSSGENGWEVNPSPANYYQGFTPSRPHYDAARVPSLPYLAETDQSIVKAIYGVRSGYYSVIKTAVVLTVLMEEPSGGGAGFFRPPYVGTAKPLYAVSSLRTELLPTLAPVGTPPTLASVVSKFSECLRMDHHHAYARAMRPHDTLHDYQPNNVAHVVEAMLRLMLNDPLEDKMPALIQFTQPCIDRLYAHMLGQGQGWSGHDPGHRPMAGWAAVMLNITEGLTSLADAAGVVHQEDYYLVIGGTRALWGNVYSAEWQYWNFLVNGSGGSSPKDPYGVIDGGILRDGPHFGGPGDSYQVIMAQPWKGEALVCTLMPELQASWKTGFWPWFQAYADRWVTHGVWAAPDHAAPFVPGLTRNVDFGEDPANPGQPILGDGRFPSMHGLNADGGQNSSAYVGAMWNAYRDYEPPPTPPAARGRKRRGAKLLSFFR